MNLQPDIVHLLGQVVIFIFVWIGLSRMAFAPTSTVLDQRRKRTVAAEEEASAMVASAEADRETYEVTVHQRRAQMSEETTTARNRAQEESAKVLAEARESANQALAAQRDAVAKQVDSARDALAKSADDIAKQMLGRVTGGTA